MEAPDPSVRWFWFPDASQALVYMDSARPLGNLEIWWTSGQSPVLLHAIEKGETDALLRIPSGGDFSLEVRSGGGAESLRFTGSLASRLVSRDEREIRIEAPPGTRVEAVHWTWADAVPRATTLAVGTGPGHLSVPIGGLPSPLGEVLVCPWKAEGDGRIQGPCVAIPVLPSEAGEVVISARRQKTYDLRLDLEAKTLPPPRVSISYIHFQGGRTEEFEVEWRRKPGTTGSAAIMEIRSVGERDIFCIGCPRQVVVSLDVGTGNPSVCRAFQATYVNADRQLRVRSTPEAKAHWNRLQGSPGAAVPGSGRREADELTERMPGLARLLVEPCASQVLAAALQKFRPASLTIPALHALCSIWQALSSSPTTRSLADPHAVLDAPGRYQNLARRGSSPPFGPPRVEPPPPWALTPRAFLLHESPNLPDDAREAVLHLAERDARLAWKAVTGGAPLGEALSNLDRIRFEDDRGGSARQTLDEIKRLRDLCKGLDRPFFEPDSADSGRMSEKVAQARGILEQRRPAQSLAEARDLLQPFVRVIAEALAKSGRPENAELARQIREDSVGGLAALADVQTGLEADVPAPPQRPHVLAVLNLQDHRDRSAEQKTRSALGKIWELLRGTPICTSVAGPPISDEVAASAQKLKTVLNEWQGRLAKSRGAAADLEGLAREEGIDIEREWASFERELKELESCKAAKARSAVSPDELARFIRDRKADLRPALMVPVLAARLRPREGPQPSRRGAAGKPCGAAEDLAAALGGFPEGTTEAIGKYRQWKQKNEAERKELQQWKEWMDKASPEDLARLGIPPGLPLPESAELARQKAPQMLEEIAPRLRNAVKFIGRLEANQEILGGMGVLDLLQPVLQGRPRLEAALRARPPRAENGFAGASNAIARFAEARQALDAYRGQLVAVSKADPGTPTSLPRARLHLLRCLGSSDPESIDLDGIVKMEELLGRIQDLGGTGEDAPPWQSCLWLLPAGDREPLSKYVRTLKRLREGKDASIDVKAVQDAADGVRKAMQDGVPKKVKVEFARRIEKFLAPPVRDVLREPGEMDLKQQVIWLAKLMSDLQSGMFKEPDRQLLERRLKECGLIDEDP